ncbi:hypothetical protein Q787_03075 [Ornithobacterium rhinotracheale H06-030791]|nr:hypothetical protein Q785_03200 [Ornithobacterium rhinotracheale ORT-UMN 88]KGB67242.1 hypothetical protein Q787_03075 [Ornithobacterium rhinotracheale H06-030791]
MDYLIWLQNYKNLEKIKSNLAMNNFLISNIFFNNEKSLASKIIKK